MPLRSALTIGKTKRQLLVCHRSLSPRIAQIGYDIWRQLSFERAIGAPLRQPQKNTRLKAPREAGFHAIAREYCSFRVRLCHSEEAALAPATQVTAIGPRKFRTKPSPVSEGWISGEVQFRSPPRNLQAPSIAGQLTPILLSELLAVRRFAAPDGVCLPIDSSRHPAGTPNSKGPLRASTRPRQ